MTADIVQQIQNQACIAAKALYGLDLGADQMTVQPTRKEFTGDYTLVVFPLVQAARKAPEAIAAELGDYLKNEVPLVADFNVVKGFLNLVVSDAYWSSFLLGLDDAVDYGRQPGNGKKVMVEFSSPNTNKPLHLGHIRNILLGWSTAKILDAAGYDVVKVQIINDRGIAICKSMLAWQLFANGATPQSTGTKPDHFVGDYYVLFEQKFKAEYKAWQQSDAGAVAFEDWKAKVDLPKTEKRIADERAKDLKELQDNIQRGLVPDGSQLDESKYTLENHFFAYYKQQYFNTHSELGLQARQMLLRWEAGDAATVALWRTMNAWVYEGFDATYAALGVNFDKLYYESETYLLGKDMVDAGIAKGVFYNCEDGSVEIDLSDAKLDKKKILRSDGTSLYVTQDLGTAHQRYLDFGVEKMVYVVADEQNYHFQVLFEVLKRLEEPYADGLYHLSYGMVDLPTGKMKSREGTVVDADDLIADVVNEVRENARERDTLSELDAAAQERVLHQVGLAALKYFIIKVHPQKRMVFDPKESVDLQGQTGPYIQNAYVRIQSVLRKAEGVAQSHAAAYQALAEGERELIQLLYGWPGVLQQAAAEYDPSSIAQFSYALAKTYHKFYHDHSILNAESEAARDFRLALSAATARTLQFSMGLLGVEMPERM